MRSGFEKLLGKAFSFLGNVKIDGDVQCFQAGRDRCKTHHGLAGAEMLSRFAQSGERERLAGRFAAIRLGEPPALAGWQ